MLRRKAKKKWTYLFGNGRAEGDANMKNLLGGKGANLAEMNLIKLPVPPGFTITTEASNAFYENDGKFPDGLEKEVQRALRRLEKISGGKFGHEKRPLLLSVRSGARASMPGMMDTVLNLGLNDATTEALARRTQDPRFAYDSYRRFIQIYADIVLGIEHHLFEDILESHKMAKGYLLDTNMTGEDWKDIVKLYKKIVAENTDQEFPQSPQEQLWGAIAAVFHSWNNVRAQTYRRLHVIPHSWGTAVNIQAMVFGNMGNKSATGVAFTRNPANGENEFYGEFLLNAQGEDVVAGLRTPSPLTKKSQQEQNAEPQTSMEEIMPKAFSELAAIRKKLEQHYRDMQDIEFTIENGKLWMLQTRAAKRTAAAALRCAADMVTEGLITEEEAVERIEPTSLDQLLHPMLDPDAKRDVLTRGLPASPGAASGEIVFTSAEAERLKHQGRRVILVRHETSPEDIHGMHAAEGILTARGGMTSHAAVVARGMGRPCVAGASAVRIDTAKQNLEVDGRMLALGDIITIDGITGEVIYGEVPQLQPQMSDNFVKIMQWADKFRRMNVRANAETKTDTKTARSFGAQGIGLCRTEHMFFDIGRVRIMREMILAKDKDNRHAALAQLMPLQRQDFVELFEIMSGFPVTIRLLDPPLHEFLPHENEIPQVARELDVEEDYLRRRVAQLSETNPMLGHRGCRLGITSPEIYEMQTRAILEAAHIAQSRNNAQIFPEIMIPLIAMKSELEFIKDLIVKIAKEVITEKGVDIPYHIGTMIELPRAALCADALAESADFFSFGTNDLTQTTFGISRDDAARFIGIYAQEGLFERNPFVTIDIQGVGSLMRMACAKGRQTRADIQLGVCGEHGGDPTSIQLCEEIGLDYISCSPYRVPIARLAAAQATILAKKTKSLKKRERSKS